MGPDAGADVLTESWLKREMRRSHAHREQGCGRMEAGLDGRPRCQGPPGTRSFPEPSEGRGLATLGP